MAKPTVSNAMAEKNLNTAVSTALASRPDFAGKTSVGSENVTHNDLVIPRISIIQDLSPQRKKADPSYIPGAEEGMMFNSVTDELYREPVLVIPVFYRKEYLVWVVRNAGGGLRGVFRSEDNARTAINGIKEECEIVETAQNFCLISSDKGVSWSEAVVSMAKTNLSISRKWNSMIVGREADRFAQVYSLSPVAKSNSKGDFFVFKTEWAGWATKEWYDMGRKSYDAIKAGARDVARDYDSDAAAPTNGAPADEEMGF